MRTELNQGLTPAESATYAAAMSKLLGDLPAPYLRPTDRPWDARNYGFERNGQVTDAMITRMLTECWPTVDGGGVMEMPPGDQDVNTPLATITIPTPLTHPHGIRFNGSRLVPTYNDNTKPVLVFTPAGTSRGFILEQPRILGQGRTANRESHGLHLVKPTAGGAAIYGFTIVEPHIENVGGNGIRLEGDIYEGSIERPLVSGTKLTGIWAGHHASGGILSSIDIFGARVRDCGEVDADDAAGIEVGGNAVDVWIWGVHSINNGGYPVKTSNGLRYLSGHAEACHRLRASDALSTGQGAYTGNKGVLVGWYVINSTGKITHGVRTFPANKLTVIGGAVSGTVSGSVPLEDIFVTGAMSAGTRIDQIGHDATRSSTKRTNIGSGYIVDEGSIYPYVPSAPTNGGTTTVPNNPWNRNVLLRPSGTIAAHTVALPTSPRHGQEIRVHTTQEITALAYTPDVTGFTDGGTLAAGAAHVLQYENATWYRVG